MTGKLYRHDEELSFITKLPAMVEEPPVKTPVLVKPTFGLHKSIQYKFEIDQSVLAPSKAVMLSGSKFEERYRDQLNKLLYNDEEKLDPTVLFTITTLYDANVRMKGPIRLMSQQFRSKLPTVCKVLNSFYHDSNAVISGISAQLNDSIPDAT